MKTPIMDKMDLGSDIGFDDEKKRVNDISMDEQVDTDQQFNIDFDDNQAHNTSN